MLIKLGESTQITDFNIPVENIMADVDIQARFQKFAAELKRIAPKANDFLYFSAIMMHSAESALINPDGSPKTDRYGKKIEANWEINNDSWKWRCSDPSIRPYKNANGDIFPETELLKAYKQWVGKPLCIDHKSNSVDAIRGIIVDTYYDRLLKRVVALCALDKINYPDLAHKVATGVAHSVSMGTAVKVAICYDCGQAARTEKDFCRHMQTKSSYGEINIDLQPIELSIVVNGADPQAKIKHIVAAADHIANYLTTKQAELLNDNLKNNLEDLEQEINKIKEKVSALKEEALKTNQDHVGMAGTIDSDSVELENTDANLNLPQRFANDSNLNEIDLLRQEMQEKLARLENNLENLSKNLYSTKEENMSKDSMNKSAYFQGAGGVNEPTPGKRKYEVDKLQDDLRNNSDKHMVGQKPFPDSGDVKGLHPSPDSVAEKNELTRKQKLSRAELEERALRRSAAVEKAKETLMNSKQAYFQGGGGVNEPTPGKPKYEVDKLQDELRNKSDKHMVGQKPFPDVGNVDGLHPSPESVAEKDELKRKQKLSRAGLTAKFVKAAKEDGVSDLANSAWQVFQDDKLVLTASVDELTGGNAEMLYDSIATKEFGTKLLTKVRDLGIKQASAELVKKSQALPEAAPAPAAEAVASPAASVAEEPAAGGTGDVKETAVDLADKAVEVASDLKEAVHALVGEQAEMGELEGLTGKTASLNKVRKELNKSLILNMKQSIANLEDVKNEMDLITSTMTDAKIEPENMEFVTSVAQDSFTEAKESLASAYDLMKSFVNYVRGSEELVKQAMESCADDKPAADQMPAHDDVMEDFETETDEADKLIAMLEAETAQEEAKQLEDNLEADLADDQLMVDEQMADVMVKTKDEAKQAVDALKPGDSMKMAGFDLSTKEGRAAYRTKLAADMKFDEILDDAHPKGGVTLKLDSKVSDDLAHVEDLKEKHQMMLDMVKAPVKLKKEAERLHQLISAGTVATEQLDALIAQGLDPAVVKYYKDFYGQAGSEGKEFAAELTKEHIKSKVAEEMTVYRTKLARAYEVANEMVRKGLCADDSTAIRAQVDEIMEWNDNSFDSMKRILAKHSAPLNKTAGLPQVGLLDEVGTHSATVAKEDDLLSEFGRMFAGKRY